MTTHNELIIRAATDEDIPAIVNLFSICLRDEGGSPTADFWRWKHLDNPFGKSPVLLAFSNQQLVGLRAFLRWQWRQNDKVLSAYRAVDTATHPDFQGQGIFRNLTTQLWNQIQQEDPGCFVYNTPNDKSRPGYLKMGWQVLGKPYAEFRLVPGLGLDRKSNWERAVESLNAIDFDKISNIGQSRPFPELIQTDTSSGYYAWRYQTVPDRQYGFWQAETNHGVAGFLFYLRNRSGFTELRICDELVLEDDANACQVLDAGWSLLARKFAGCVVTRLCHSPKLGSKLLQRFIPNVTLRLPEDKSALPLGLSNINNWNFEMGALELF
jgi:GNAT superfamily N-acetyltransferase